MVYYVLTIGNEDDLDTLITETFDSAEEMREFVRKGNHYHKRQTVYTLNEDDVLIHMFTLEEVKRGCYERPIHYARG